MICPKCGFKNSSRAKFCNECGSSLSDSEEKNTPLAENDALPSLSTTAAGGTTIGAETEPLDLPPFSDEVSEATESSFSSLDIPELPEITPSKEELQKDSETVLSGRDQSDERLVDALYVPPKKTGNLGDTMEIAPLKEDDSLEQRTYKAPDQNKKRSKGKIFLLFCAAALGIAAVGAVVSYQMELWGGKSLPDVVGKTKVEATQTLEGLGFVVKSIGVRSDDTENKVLLMDPGAGKRLSEKSEIVLQVATPRVIPDILGKTTDFARNGLSGEGFERVEYLKLKSNEAEDTVLSVDPVPGTKASALTLITVTIAESYVVPEVNGLSLSSARELLTEEGYKTKEQYVYSEAKEGTVMGSEPASGTKLPSGSEITISIAKSRATELVNATNAYLSERKVLEIGGTSYEIVSVGGISYTQENTTQATVQVVGVTTLSDGEVVRGAQKQRTITFTWNANNTLAGYL